MYLAVYTRVTIVILLYFIFISFKQSHHLSIPSPNSNALQDELKYLICKVLSYEKNMTVKSYEKVMKQLIQTMSSIIVH